MPAHRHPAPDAASSPVVAALAWLGGGERRAAGARHERSAQVTAAVVVLVAAMLAWLVAAAALAESTAWPLPAVVAATAGVGLLVGALSRAISAGATRGRGIAGRVAVAVAVGLAIGELAAVVVFTGPVEQLIDERAARIADSTPAVAQAVADLDRSRTARTQLDQAVDQAVQRRQEALVVARCEFNPRPDCPPTSITGVPGAGPETRTANDYLADAQRALDAALAEQARQAPALDARIADDEQALAQARQAATAGAEHGLGVRWVAMHDHTTANPGAGLLRVLIDGFFVLLGLLPLILARWRGQTSDDRAIAADDERDRAERHADTAVAVKRAEVRAAIDTMWAEHQLASARMAVEAQLEIEREQQRRRVIEAVEQPLPARSERIPEPAVDTVYLPIAAEAEAASLRAAALPTAEESVDVSVPENVPARTEAVEAVEAAAAPGRPLIPVIPDVTRAAARWIRPLVPPIIVTAIDTTTRPLRGVRQVFEETEEIHFSLRRTRRVTSYNDEGDDSAAGHDSATPAEPSTARRANRQGVGPKYTAPAMTSGGRPAELSGGDQRELSGRRGPRELPPGR